MELTPHSGLSAPAQGSPVAPKQPKKRIVIAGASGFVGSHLIEAFGKTHELIGLTRSEARAMDREDRSPIQWVLCDLYSLREVRECLQGADLAIYLVHSMLPSSRLTQATFEDLDWILADNFARAAAENEVRQIVYLGGLIPEETRLSPHLRSRLEVERTLAAYGTPVTALRAGIVVGAGGSSLSMLVNLVGRLPVMLLPSWTESRTQPIAVRDLIRAFQEVLDAPRYFGQALDVGGPEVMSYRELIQTTARVMGKKRWLIPLPIFSARLSTLWIRLITGAPQALVRPLIESLRHEMVARPNPLLEEIQPNSTPFATALRDALRGGKEARKNAGMDRIRRNDQSKLKSESRVKSIQRLQRPETMRATEVSEEYFRWLNRRLRPFVRVEVNGQGDATFRIPVLKRPLLKLSYHSGLSSPDRRLYYITDGLLVRQSGNRRARFEFRDTPDNPATLCAIHDFLPKIPWAFYKWTQAKVHLLVMSAFRRHLDRARRLQQTKLKSE